MRVATEMVAAFSFFAEWYSITVSMTTGEIFRDTREKMGFSEKEVADDLQIPLKFIRALERDDFSSLPARIYTRGFVAKYADYLELDAGEAMAVFDGERPSVPMADESGNGLRTSGAGWTSFLNRQKILFAFFLAALFIVGVYFLYEFRYVLGEPELIISSPQGNIVTNENVFSVSGRVERESDLTLNGRPIYTNEQGEFKDTALLVNGLNALEFEAKDRFGKTNKAVRYVLVK